MSDKPTDQPWVLRLYVAGMTQTAHRAERNAKQLLQAHLGEAFTLETVDILQTPIAAEKAQILAVPTLVRELPNPVRKIIGDLSDAAGAAAGLELPPLIPGAVPA